MLQEAGLAWADDVAVSRQGGQLGESFRMRSPTSSPKPAMTAGSRAGCSSSSVPSGLPIGTGSSAVHAPSARLKSPAPPHTVFFQMRYGCGPQLHPEVYLRPRGEVYVYGAAEDEPKKMPDDPAKIVQSANACDRLSDFARSVSSRLSPELASESMRQSCCLPVSPDGLPVIA